MGGLFGGGNTLGSLDSSSNMVRTRGINAAALGSGEGNSVVQGNRSLSVTDGNNNVLGQHRRDSASVDGSDNQVYQPGRGNEASLDGDRSRIFQGGRGNEATITADDAGIGQHGRHNTATVDGNNTRLQVFGDNNQVNLDGEDMRVKVYGDGLTVSQNDAGQVVALDRTGRPVPVTQGEDGGIVVGQPPALDSFVPSSGYSTLGVPQQMPVQPAPFAAPPDRFVSELV